MSDDSSSCSPPNPPLNDALDTKKEEKHHLKRFHGSYKKGNLSPNFWSLSSQSSLPETECFKLFSKGLVSKELVKDNEVIFAAIGIVILDPNDKLIFEMNMPLEVFEENDEVKNSVWPQLEALVKGMKHACSLKLKKLISYGDDHILYVYATGLRKPIRGTKVEKLVNQMSHLQTKFKYWNTLFSTDKGPRGIKLAFKSARDAIVSQIQWPMMTNGTKLMETCRLCSTYAFVNNIFTVDNCLHRYCFNCMGAHVKFMLLREVMPKCPHGECQTALSIDSCRKFLKPGGVELMARVQATIIPYKERVYCPSPRCSMLMSRQKALEYTQTAGVGVAEIQGGARKCGKCKNLFCINCRVPWHKNMTCNEYKNSASYTNGNDGKLDSLARRESWKICVNCNHMIELADGCNEMSCM
ncbi:RBR-type E3 ubiquitin transferase [Quillaja saponaria]|uniref:RBR-type E3 ubiquitin transferase n=1 Tax=Quillaja saponaria TaxID=32244 RepID=A0AAD7PA69_QUISA|nr:RBR-type E3 ubiquitin transferase [Quillaja saponaria]